MSAITERQFLYVGCFTSRESSTANQATGISVFERDPSTGALAHRQTLEGVSNPSFLALAPGGRRLYAVNADLEVDGLPAGALSAFAVEPSDGTVALLNRQSAGLAGPCHVNVDRSGRWTLTACYHGGAVAVLPIHDDGRLGPPCVTVRYSGAGPHPTAQQGPHAHSINLDAANRFALVCNQGLDKVYWYQVDAEQGGALGLEQLTACCRTRWGVLDRLGAAW